MSNDRLQGRRVPDDSDGLAVGEYCRLKGVWHAHTPHQHLIANLGSHRVIEHADGTITVEPSIIVSNPAYGTWHGFLENGIWREH